MWAKKKKKKKKKSPEGLAVLGAWGTRVPTNHRLLERRIVEFGILIKNRLP